MKMATTKEASDQRALLLQLIDECYDKTAWHGPNLKSSVRRVTAQEAVWRPRPARRNIAEIAVHCAYWKYAVRRRITGAKRGSFPLKGSNWCELPAKLTTKQWREYLSLLDEQHAALREAVLQATSAQLLKGRQPAAHIHGIALHDVYHAGQIRTLRTLHKQATSRGSKARK
jgi:hypothetical protein